MNCKSCNSILRENAKYCHHCGDEVSIEKVINDIKRKPKGYITSVIYGVFSICFFGLSFLSSISIYYSYYFDYDKLAIISLLSSIIFFSIISMLCGVIGFLKARIVKKGGYYTTTSTVLNIFGVMLSLIEIFFVIIASFLVL